VCLTVSHTGSGKGGPVDCGIFEPLVGSGAAGHGSRSGLSMIGELVRRQGGRLSVCRLPHASDGDRPSGTAFRVCLPAHRGAGRG